MTKTTHVQDEFGKDNIFLTTVFSLKQSSLRKYRPVIDAFIIHVHDDRPVECRFQTEM